MSAAGLPPPSRVFLAGLPGSGKSTVAPLLAALLGWRAADVDQVVEMELGRSVAEIFAVQGAGAFRAAERRALAALCRRTGVVVGLGGGTLEDPVSRARVRAAGPVLWLDAADAVLTERCQRETGRRPLLAGGAASAIARLRARREPVLRGCGSRVETGGVDPLTVASACAARVGPVAAPALGERP